MMFTAKEARELAGRTVEEKVEDILVAIKEAASPPNKKRSLSTGWGYKPDEDLWIRGGYSRTEDWKKATKILEDLGFKVSFYYSDGSFVVDMYTLIEW